MDQSFNGSRSRAGPEDASKEEFDGGPRHSDPLLVAPLRQGSHNSRGSCKQLTTAYLSALAGHSSRKPEDDPRQQAVASPPSDTKQEEPTFAFQEEEYTRHSQVQSTPLDDVRAVDGGDNILIKQFIQDGGKLNIRERSQERKDSNAEYRYVSQGSKMSRYDPAGSGQETALGAETATGPRETQKGQQARQLSRSGSLEVAKAVGRGTNHDAYLPAPFSGMDAKLMHSYDAHGGEPIASTSADPSDGHQHRPNLRATAIGNEYYPSEVSNNLNARCHSFENKYRILTQQKQRQGLDSSTERPSYQSLNVTPTHYGQPKVAKNSLEGMAFKSAFAQKLYSSQLQAPTLPSLPYASNALDSSLNDRAPLQQPAHLHSSIPSTHFAAQPSPIDHRPPRLVPNAGPSAFVHDPTHFRTLDPPSRPRDPYSSTTRDDNGVAQSADYGGAGQYERGRRMERQLACSFSENTEARMAGGGGSHYGKHHGGGQNRSRLPEERRSEGSLRRSRDEGREPQTAEQVERRRREEAVDEASRQVVQEIEGRNRRLKQMQSEYMRKSREFSGDAERNLNNVAFPQQNTPELTGMEQTLRTSQREEEKKSKRSTHQAKISLATLQKQFYQQKIDEMVKPRSQSKSAVAKSFNQYSEQPSEKGSRRPLREQRLEYGDREGALADGAPRTRSDRNRELSATMASGVEDQRSHSYDRDARDGFDHGVIRLENHKHRAIQPQESASRSTLMDSLPQGAQSHADLPNVVQAALPHRSKEHAGTGHRAGSGSARRRQQRPNDGPVSRFEEKEERYDLARGSEAKEKKNNERQPRRYMKPSPVRQQHDNNASPETGLKGILKNHGSQESHNGRKRSCQPGMHTLSNRPLSASSTGGNILRTQNLAHNNQNTGHLSRADSYCLNEDLYGLDQVPVGMQKDAHGQALGAKGQGGSGQFARRTSDQKVHQTLDLAPAALTLSSTYVSPAQPRWQGSHAPIPYLSSQMPTQRDAEEMQTTNPPPAQTAAAPASTTRPQSFGLNHRDHHHLPPFHPSSTSCHTCSQLTLKSAVLQEQVNQLENKNKELEERFKKSEEERNGAQGKVEEMEKELEGLRDQNQQMSKQLLQQSEIKKVVQTYDQRCQKAEEVLRKETSNSEKQRAEIKILKQAIEVELKKFGIYFKQSKVQGQNGVQSMQDGYVQLVQQQQQIEQLQDKIHSLNDKHAVMESKNEMAIRQLRESKEKEVELLKNHYVEQIVQSNDFITELKQDKASLLQDKEHLQNVIVEKNQLLKQLEDYKRRCQAYDEKEHEVRRDRDGEAGRRVSSGLSLEELKQANDLFEDEMQSLKQCLDQKDSEVAHLNAACLQREQEASGLREQLEEQAKRLKEAQESLEAALEEKQVEFDSLVAVNKEMQDQIERREAQILKYSQEIVPSLTQREAELAAGNEALRQQLEEAQQEMQRLVERRQREDASIAQNAEAQYSQLQAELEALRQKNVDAKKLEEERDQEYARLENLIVAAQTRERQLQQEMQVRLEAEKERVADLSQELAQANQLKASMQQSCIEKDEQIQKKVAASENLQHDLEHLQSQLADLRQQGSNKDKSHRNELARMQLEVDQALLEKSKVEVQLEQQKLELLKSSGITLPQGSMRSRGGEEEGNKYFNMPAQVTTSQIQSQSPQQKATTCSESPLSDLFRSKKLGRIVENLNYFADSVLNIDDIGEKYPMLGQFLKYEGNLRQVFKKCKQNPDKQSSKQAEMILTLLDNCFNCTFQTIFQLVLLNEQSEQLSKERSSCATLDEQVASQAAPDSFPNRCNQQLQISSSSLSTLSHLLSLTTRLLPSSISCHVSQAAAIVEQARQVRMRRAEIVEVQGGASGSSREIQELDDAGNKYDSQLQQALREIGDLAPVEEDSQGEITRLTEQVEALKKELSRTKEEYARKMDQAKEMTEHLRMVTFEHGGDKGREGRGEKNAVEHQNKQLNDVNAELTDSRGDLQDRVQELLLQNQLLHHELEARRYCQKCGNGLQRNSSSHQPAATALVVSPPQTTTSRQLQSSRQQTPDFVAQVSDSKLRDTVPLLGSGQTGERPQSYADQRRRKMTTQESGVGSRSAKEEESREGMKDGEQERRGVGEAAWLDRRLTCRASPVKERMLLKECQVLTERINQDTVKKFLRPDNDGVGENRYAEVGLHVMEDSQGHKAMADLQQQEAEEQSRSRYLIEMSKKILESSKRSSGHLGRQSQPSLRPEKIQKDSNQASVPSLVETQNDSHHLKSHNDQSARDKLNNWNIVDKLLPQNQNMVLHSSDSSRQGRSKQEVEGGSMQPSVTKIDEPIKIVDTSRKSSGQNRQQSILHESSCPSQGSERHYKSSTPGLLPNRRSPPESSRHSQRVDDASDFAGHLVRLDRLSRRSPGKGGDYDDGGPGAGQQPLSANDLNGICFEQETPTRIREVEERRSRQSGGRREAEEREESGGGMNKTVFSQQVVMEEGKLETSNHDTARASKGLKSDRVFVTQEGAQATSNSYSEYGEGQTEAVGVQSLISSKKNSLQSKNTMLRRPPQQTSSILFQRNEALYQTKGSEVEKAHRFSCNTSIQTQMEFHSKNSNAGLKIARLAPSGGETSTSNPAGGDSASLRSPAQPAQQKRVLGNIKLGNIHFKVSQKIKDQSLATSEGATKRQQHDSNHGIILKQSVAEISNGQTSSQASARQRQGDPSQPKIGAIHRIKIRKEPSISGDGTDRTREPCTVQPPTPNAKMHATADPIENQSSDQPKKQYTEKGEYESTQSKEEKQQNVPAQVHAGLERALRSRGLDKQLNEGNLQHEASRQSAAAILRKAMTSKDSSSGSAPISQMQAQSRWRPEVNQKTECDKQPEHGPEASSVLGSSLQNLSGRHQDAHQPSAASRTPQLPSRLLEAADENKYDGQDEEQSKELSFHKDYEMAFNAERSSSRFSSHKRSKRGLSDSQASFQKPGTTATPSLQDEAEKASNLVHSYLQRSNFEHLHLGHGDINPRKLRLLHDNEPIKEQIVESDRTGRGQSEEQLLLLDSAYADEQYLAQPHEPSVPRTKSSRREDDSGMPGPYNPHQYYDAQEDVDMDEIEKLKAKLLNDCSRSEQTDNFNERSGSDLREEALLQTASDLQFINHDDVGKILLQSTAELRQRNLNLQFGDSAQQQQHSQMSNKHDQANDYLQIRQDHGGHLVGNSRASSREAEFSKDYNIGTSQEFVDSAGPKSGSKQSGRSRT